MLLNARYICTIVINLKGLPDWRTYSTWPCQAAAYALLSRVYLYQKNWEEAANYAQKALTIHDELSDYNQFSMTDPNNAAKGLNGFEPNVVRDPEVVLSKAASNNFTDVMASDKLIQCYNKARDLRFRYFFSNKTRYEVQLDGYMRVNENPNIETTTYGFELVNARLYFNTILEPVHITVSGDTANSQNNWLKVKIEGGRNVRFTEDFPYFFLSHDLQPQLTPAQLKRWIGVTRQLAAKSQNEQFKEQLNKVVQQLEKK